MNAQQLSRTTGCLHCQLRHVLRRAAATGTHYRGGLLPRDIQRRFESTETFSHQPQIRYSGHNDIEYKVISPHGKIRRFRGKKQREEIESLGIKSLGRVSEVIVLRDVPEDRDSRSQRPAEQHSADKVVDITQSLTPEQIQALFKKQKSPKQEEVNSAIDEHRPQQEVVSQQEYDKCSSTLYKGYNIKQLKRYFELHIPQTKIRAAKSKGEKKPEARDEFQVQRVVRDQWRETTADARSPPSSVPQAPQVGGYKRAIIRRIITEAWDVQVEEEAEVIGELDLVLTPAQWGLLHIRDAANLFQVMRSRKFYQNSVLERDSTKGAIRIIGPRNEAHDIADLFENAFKDVKSIVVNSNILQGRHREGNDRVRRSMQRNLSADSLRTIMAVTKTYLAYEEHENQLHVYGFQENAVNDALRLIMALIDPPGRRTSKMILHVTEQLALSPVFANKSLHSSVRQLDLGRLTQPATISRRETLKSETLNAAEGSGTLQSEALDIAKGSETLRSGALNIAQASETGNPRALVIAQNSTTFQDVIRAIRLKDTPNSRKLKLPPEDRTRKSYWVYGKSTTPWQATMGYVLHHRDVADINQANSARIHSLDAKSAVDDAASHRVYQEEAGSHRTAPFVAQVPSLITALSYFQGARLGDRRRSILSSQLIVRLIPSPFSNSGAQALISLPTVELVFSFDAIHAPDTIPSHSPDHTSFETKSHIFPIDDKMSVTLREVNAILQEFVTDLALPSHAVDIRFQKQDHVSASRTQVMADRELRSFIDAIVTSLRSGGELRAPQNVQLKIASWMVRGRNTQQVDKSAKTGEKKGESKYDAKYTYFFAGFEHRSRRRFGPVHEGRDFDTGYWSEKHALYVHEVEGGLSGGARTEIFVQRNMSLPVLGNETDKATGGEQEEGVEDKEKQATGLTQADFEDSGGGAAPFVRTALSFVKLLDGVQKGIIGPMNRDVDVLDKSGDERAGASDMRAKKEKPRHRRQELDQERKGASSGVEDMATTRAMRDDLSSDETW